MGRQILFACVAAGAIFVLLAWTLGGIPAAQIAVTAGLAVQVSTGFRMLTGIRTDLAAVKKSQLEMEKLVSSIHSDVIQIEKAKLEIKKLQDELARISSRVHIPEPDETAKFGGGEVVNSLLERMSDERRLKR